MICAAESHSTGHAYGVICEMWARVNKGLAIPGELGFMERQGSSLRDFSRPLTHSENILCQLRTSGGGVLNAALLRYADLISILFSMYCEVTNTRATVLSIGQLPRDMSSPTVRIVSLLGAVVSPARGICLLTNCPSDHQVSLTGPSSQSVPPGHVLGVFSAG